MPIPTPIKIFDPGIEDTLMLLDSVCETLSTVQVHRPASLREGEFKVNEAVERMFNVLFDSGALHRSYINEDIVEKHREEWSDKIKPHKSWVRLADQKTVVQTKEAIRGVISFVSDGGTEYSGEVDAIVWRMKGLDFILGLPDIVRNFITLFFLMLKQYQLELLGSVQEECVLPGEVLEWSSGDYEEAPEEAECPIPVAHEPILLFMETTHEEALKAYVDMLEDHIGENLKSCKEFKEILLSELAVERFVPKDWTGIKGFPPLELQFKESLPDTHPVRSRPINPRLYELAKKEFDRLCKYNYRPSTSPWAAPLVPASKNGPPYIRLCGDFKWVNPHIVMPQAYIPRVEYEIEKASNFRIFLDIDMTNAFHQFPLAPSTSQKLAIQTPWGLVEPVFMPEGISPASGHLQVTMMKMFSDFEAWSIIIFDNILLLASDQADACVKLRKFLERCEKHNVFLKMPKSWFGFSSVKFFGYKISYGKREMDADRKKTMLEYTMPTSQKGMQRFLGAALFFKRYVANYSDVAAKLHKMTHKDFNWDRRTWTEDYEGEFEKMKQALANSIALHFPDYSLPWTLRVDASDVAVGAVLYQTRTDSDGNEVQEPIGFASQKFSGAAARWDAFKKEAYALYFGVSHFAYYLRGKSFVVETDHRNLLWIEKSEVPMVVRWRVFLQSFNMYLKHIAGTKNLVADWLSRMLGYLDRHYVHMDSAHADISCLISVITCMEDEDLAAMPSMQPPEYLDVQPSAATRYSKPDFQDFAEGTEVAEDVPVEPVVDTVLPEVEQHVPFETVPSQEQGTEADERADEAVVTTRVWTAKEMFDEVHGGRKMHWGARRTWLALGKRFRNHKIPYRWIVEMVEQCPVCQLYRRGFENHLEEIVTHLKPPHHRARVGFDGLTITPPDSQGNTHLIVVVDHFSKYVWGYVAKDYSALSVATALFIYYCTFGVFDEVWSDPGSNIMSDVVRQLNDWLQVKHVVSIVDRHESNGVEGSNKQILRHLRTLLHDLRVKDRWSDPIILCLVFFVINDQINSETGVRPLDAKFGSSAGPYLRLPTDRLPAELNNEWVVALDADLKHIRSVSAEYQRKLAEERTKATPPDQQVCYQPGDLVFWRRDPDAPLPTKMDAPYTGPYEVLEQKRNYVRARHVVMETEKTLHVSRLKLFLGTKEQAFDLALRDKDQYVVVAVKAWKGNPHKRSGMKFWVEYDDGDAMWVSYKPDLAANAKFQEYVETTTALFALRYSAIEFPRHIATMRNFPITAVQPGDHVYVDLRFIKGHEVFEKLGLPDAYFKEYVCECSIVRWVGPNHRKVEAKVLVLDVLARDWDNYDIYQFGSQKVLKPDMVVVSEALCIRYPDILESRNRKKLLRMYNQRA